MTATSRSCEGLHGEILYDEAAVSRGIRWLAQETVERYRDEPKPLFVALLRGAMPFASQFMHAIVRADPSFHPELDTVTIQTYGRQRSAGTPELVLGIDLAKTAVQDRRVVLLDDMIDQGITAAFASEYFMGLGAQVVDVAALTIKQRMRAPQFSVLSGEAVACFEVPDVFITGMGMDDSLVAHEGNRWLSYIAIANNT